MIKAHYIILLLVVGGSVPTLADEDDPLEDEDDSREGERNCLNRLREDCPTDSFPYHFPKTADELLTFCRTLSEHGRCAIKVREDCQVVNKDLITQIQSIVNYVESTCQIGNPRFEAIATNLECIKEALNTSEEICRSGGYNEDTEEFMIRHVLPFMEEAIYLNEYNLHCVYALFYTGCPSINVGIHCGREAREAVYEVRQKTVTFVPKCEDEVMNEIEPLLDLYEEVIMKRLSEENVIGDRK